MNRRIACIALPDIRLEIARDREPQSLLVVIVARRGTATQTERDVLGNTRIDFVSREAGAFGVRAGQTVAAARAKCAELRVRVVAEGIVHTALARIAEAALAFGPSTAFDVAQDVVWVDVGGCAHLHGSENELVQALGAHVRAMGHVCRVAVAEGPRLAAAIARFSKKDLVIPEGKAADAVRSLPIAALGLDDDTSGWLADLGLSACGDLQKLPRRALGVRLGERVHDVMQLLDGRDPTPLEAWRPPEVPEERIELDWGAHSIEALSFVLKTLCDRLAARLQGRALAATRLELVIALDRALCEDGGHRVALPLALPSPISRPTDLLAIVRARLEGCLLSAPAVAVTLRAPELARTPARTLDLLSAEPKARLALPRLVAELAAEHGEKTVGILALVDTWRPIERTRLIPYGSPREREPKHALVTSALEPSRLVHASKAPREVLARARHLARTEAIEWWRHSTHSAQARRDGRHDLFVAWMNDALAWLELRSPEPAPLLRGWID
jgi:protein ImuB